MDVSEYMPEMAASDVVESCMSKYAEFTNTTKFPNAIDGLKPIQRRVLLVMKTITKPTKVASVTGRMMDQYHPHGDASISDAIVRLAQPFRHGFPLVYSGGNVGAYGGGKAAAGRYLDVVMSKFASKTFFEGVNTDTFTYVPSATGEGYEPIYLIPKIPTAFLIISFGMGVGYSTNTPAFGFLEVCSLAKRFIEARKRGPLTDRMKNILCEHLVPDYPIDTLLRNGDELITAYRAGSYAEQIVTDGTMTLTNTTITIHTLPNEVPLKEAYRKIGMDINNRVGFWADNFTRVDDLSTGNQTGRVELTLKRGTSPFDVLNTVKQKIEFTKRFRPQWRYVGKNDQNRLYTPFELLEEWWTERYRSVVADLKHRQKQLIVENRKLDAELIVIDHAEEVFELFHKAKNAEETACKLVQRFGLTLFQAKYLAELKFHQITSKGKEDLIKAKQRNLERLQEMRREFAHIDLRLIKDIEELERTFGKEYERRTKVPCYQGWVLIDNVGAIAYDEPKDAEKIMTRFPSSSCRLIPRPEGYEYVSILTDTGVSIEPARTMPREMSVRDLVWLRELPTRMVVMREGQAFRTEQITQAPPTDSQWLYAGDRITTVGIDGSIETVPTDTLTLRLRSDARGTMVDWLGFANYIEDGVLVTANSSDQGSLRLYRIRGGSGKISVIPTGETKILGLFPFGQPAAMSIPDSCRKRGNAGHLTIVDLAAAVGDNQLTVVKIPKGSVATI